MKNKEVDGLVQKIENAGSLLELKYFLEQMNEIIEYVNSSDQIIDIKDFIDLDELPVFSDTCPDNVDFLSDDCDVKSYDDTKLLCANGLNVWLEDREYFND